MKVPFSPPFIDRSVIDEVVDTLESGWITTGPKAKALEGAIADLVGAPAVLTVNSWTSGAILMLSWLGLRPGDEVVIPAYTYAATALAVMHAGGMPVMADADDSFNVSPEAVRKAITPRTKAIIPVDIAGFPCDYGALRSIVSDPEVIKLFAATSPVQEKLGRILILGDAAHSLGAFYAPGKRIGTNADLSIFSLHAVKNITTAEGGAIAFNLPAPFDNAQLYTELRQYSLNCQTKDAFTKTQAGAWRYDITGLGFKCNMPDVNAAIALAQLRMVEQISRERKRGFDRYTSILSHYPWAILPRESAPDGRQTSYHIFPLRVKGISEAQRDRMIELISKRDVAVNVHFLPLPMLSYFASLGYDIKDYPKAYENYAHEISLPIYPQLSDAMVDAVANAVVEAYSELS